MNTLLNATGLKFTARPKTRKDVDPLIAKIEGVLDEYDFTNNDGLGEQIDTAAEKEVERQIERTDFAELLDLPDWSDLVKQEDIEEFVSEDAMESALEDKADQNELDRLEEALDDKVERSDYNDLDGTVTAIEMRVDELEELAAALKTPGWRGFFRRLSVLFFAPTTARPAVAR